MLSFKEFCEQRVKTKNLNKEGNLGIPELEKKPGFLYEGCCYIEEINDDNWGRYQLTIGNWSECSDWIKELEEKLYKEWYVPELNEPDCLKDIEFKRNIHG